MLRRASMMGIAALNPSYVLLAGACCDEAELPRLRGASHVAAGRWSAARTCDGHGRQATARRALCRMEEVHALWSALLVGGRATLAPMHPATEQARMQEQARRRRHLKKPCTALIVVSGAVARSPGEAAPSHRKPLDVKQTDSVRNGATPTRATWPSTGAAGTRCRLCGCASVAGGWGDDHHTAAARVLASTARGL